MAVTDMDAGAMHVFTNSLLPFRAAFWFTLIQATFADHVGRLSAQESTPIAGATGVQSPAQTQLELIGEDPPAAPFFAGPIPRTRFIADDSGLNDVCGIGQLAWAVGERGVILRSADAGFTWSAQLLPIECSLQSVCFLTNQIGFVAGTQFNQFERRLQGILLGTKDGGSTWTQIRSEKLPSVRQIRFFDLANGIAICSPDQPNESSQVLRTSNGGATWQLVESDIKLTRWSAGDFLTPNDGILAGDGNSYGAIVSDEVVALAEPQNTLRRIRGASISRDGKGWLAGDGGVLLMSSNGGITWSATTNHLPPRMNEVFDFGSVDHRGSDVCIVGSPGCAILCSNDGGSSWRVSRTDSPVPLKKVQFVGDSVALAVGAFGVIHRSDDGGRTWRTVRNGEYRSAVLCLNADPEDVSFRMLAAMSGDQGYRSVIVQPSARLPQPGIDGVQNAQRVSVAASHAGAGFYDFEWRFARTQPMQEMTRGEIMEAWSQQTDGRIGEVLPQRLAQLIRVWRPEVVCVEYSGSENQLGPLMLQALEAAIRIAGSESAESTPGLLAECGLRPVQVKRIVARVPGGST